MGADSAGRAACGGVLERFEGLVLGEALAEMLRALRAELVVAEAANKGQIGVSAAADT